MRRNIEIVLSLFRSMCSRRSSLVPDRLQVMLCLVALVNMFVPGDWHYCGTLEIWSLRLRLLVL